MWLCLGLDPHGRGHPNRWARWDWPLWVRTIDPHPDSQVCDNAWAVRELYRVQLTLDDQPEQPRQARSPGCSSTVLGGCPQAVERYRRRLCRRARHHPRHAYNWQRDRFAIWHEVAREVFDTHAPDHKRRRREAARRLQQRDLAERLFGRLA